MQQTMAVSKNAFHEKQKCCNTKTWETFCSGHLSFLLTTIVTRHYHHQTSCPREPIHSISYSQTFWWYCFLWVYSSTCIVCLMCESLTAIEQKKGHQVEINIIPFALNHAPPLILWWCSAALSDHFAANFRGLQRNVPCLTRCNVNRAHQQRFWALFHRQLVLRSQAIETRCEDEEAPVAPAKMQNNAK